MNRGDIRMSRKIKCIIAIVVLLMANVVSLCANTDNVYAFTYKKNDKKDISKRNVFKEKSSEYKNVDKKVKREKQKHSTVAKKEVEDYLNENGVFDEDIKGLFTDAELKELDCKDFINAEIYITYYAVEDTKELTDAPLDEKTMIELSDEQVDKYMAQKYFSEDTGLYEELENEFQTRKDKKKKSMGDKFFEAIGVKPIEVYAQKVSGKSLGGVDDKKNPSMLKKVWLATQGKKNGYIKVKFEAIWTEMPKHRNLDIVKVEWDRAEYLRSGVYSSVRVKHFWDEKIEYVSTTGKKTEKNSYSKNVSYVASKEQLKNNEYHIRSEFIYAAIELHSDAGGYSTSNMQDVNTYVVNEGITFNFYVKPNEGAEYVDFYLDYLHTIENTDGLSVIIQTVAGGGLSFIPALYDWGTGALTKVETVKSGIERKFTFYCK